VTNIVKKLTMIDFFTGIVYNPIENKKGEKEMKKFNNNTIVDNWGTIRKMTEKEMAREEMIKRTEKATKGKNRIFDPFRMDRKRS